MRTLWYIGREVSRGYLLVLLLLLALVSLLALLDQLEDVGDGRFGVMDAWFTVLGMAPARAVSLLPFVALLGTLYALADLSRRSELAALQAAGRSRLQLAMLAMLPAVLWSGLALPLDEFVAAPLERGVLHARLLAKADGASVLPGSGIWSRQRLAPGGERLVNVGELVDGEPQRVRLYQFDPDGRLQRWLRADRARIDDRGWQLQGVRTTIFLDAQVQHSSSASAAVPQLWGAALPLAPLPLSSLSLSQLGGYIAALDSTGQARDRVRAAFWQRLTLPLTVLAMALLAVPFGFVHMRSGGIALRLSLGAGAGVVFYVGEQIVASSAVLAGVPAALAAVAPALVVSALALALLRWR